MKRVLTAIGFLPSLTVAMVIVTSRVIRESWPEKGREIEGDKRMRVVKCAHLGIEKFPALLVGVA